MSAQCTFLPEPPVYDPGEFLPEEQQFAKLARGAYSTTDAHLMTEGTMYNVHPNPSYTNATVTTYVNRNDPHDIVIAHRGTDLKSKDRLKDVWADFAFAIGRGGVNKRFRDRRKFTEKIIRESGADKVHLTGHSLGGGTVNHAIANSQYIRDNLTSAHTYNAAANPFWDNSQKINDPALDEKVWHHRKEGDPVSEGFVQNLPFGKLDTKTSTKSFFDRAIMATNPALAFAKTTRDTHGIDNFYDN